jgi:hypothetical protein
MPGEAGFSFGREARRGIAIGDHGAVLGLLGTKAGEGAREKEGLIVEGDLVEQQEAGEL